MMKQAVLENVFKGNKEAIKAFVAVTKQAL